MAKPVKKSAVSKPQSSEKAPKSALPLTELDQLAAWLAKAPVNEVEVEQKGLRLRLSKSSAPAGSQMVASVAAPASSGAAPAPQTPQVADISKNTFKSPMVGTYYRASSPDSQPFVKEGDSIAVGQALCIIEAMKTMNQITSDRAGKLTKILIENAKPVEFGQPLFVIE